MRGIRPVLDELVTALKAAGFTGSGIDPAEVNPPAAVWVQPRGISGLTLGGDAELLVWLYLIAPNVDVVQALDMLDDGLEGLLELNLSFADVDDPIDCTAAVILPHTSTPLPAYRLAVVLDLGD